MQVGPFGLFELVFIFVLALLIFGPKKLPEIGKTIGKGMREFKKATNDLKSNWDEHLKDVESPVQDLKDSFNEVQADVANATSLDNLANLDNLDIEDPTPPTTAEETPAAVKPEETKPDAHAS
jgi:sec-independent protein translocase protein TatA